MAFFSLLGGINTFVFDMDGVLTDGFLLASESGELLRTFNIKDGYALQLAVKKGYNVALISGGISPAAEKRLAGLGIKDVFTGVGDKTAVFERFIREKGVEPRQVLYMGDDLPDYEVMKLAGLPACPEDAVKEIKNISLYISPFGGGKGCVRDVIEKVLQVQDKWI